MKLTTNILATLLILTPLFGISQQESQYANTPANPYYLNPAAGGLSDVVQIEATGRTQWGGYNGGPRTMMIMGHSQIGRKGKNVLGSYNEKDKALFALPATTSSKMKHVVGGKMTSDAIGPFAKTSAYGSYALHIPFFKSFNLGLGVGMGWSNFKVNEDRVILHQADDNSYSQFLGNTSSQNMIDVNAGLVFYNEELFVGLSTSQAINNKIKFDDVTTASTLSRHYFLVTKYRFKIEEDFAIEPSVIGKYTANAPMSFDIGGRLIMNNSTWVGFQYRTSNSLVFQVGSTIIKNLYLGYNYEHGIAGIKTANNGTHELQLGIYIGKNRNTAKEIKDNKKDTAPSTEE